MSSTFVVSTTGCSEDDATTTSLVDLYFCIVLNACCGVEYIVTNFAPAAPAITL